MKTIITVKTPERGLEMEIEYIGFNDITFSHGYTIKKNSYTKSLEYIVANSKDDIKINKIQEIIELYRIIELFIKDKHLYAIREIDDKKVLVHDKTVNTIEDLENLIDDLNKQLGYESVEASLHEPPQTKG